MVKFYTLPLLQQRKVLNLALKSETYWLRIVTLGPALFYHNSYSMNRLILLIILMCSIQVFSQEKIIVKKGDTIIAKGDQIFTIDDLNKPSKPPLKRTGTQLAPPITVNNYLPEQQPVYNPPSPVTNYYYDSNMESISIFDVFATSSMVVIVGLLLYHHGTSKPKCSHTCEYKKEPATVNTFHINGGDANALIDKSSRAKSNHKCSHDLHQTYPSDGEGFMSSIASEYSDEPVNEETRKTVIESINRIRKEETGNNSNIILDK